MWNVYPYLTWICWLLFARNNVIGPIRPEWKSKVLPHRSEESLITKNGHRILLPIYIRYIYIYHHLSSIYVTIPTISYDMYTSCITLSQPSASPRYLLRFTSILAVFQGGNNWGGKFLGIFPRPKQPEQRHTPDCACVWWMFGLKPRMNVDMIKTFNVYVFFLYSKFQSCIFAMGLIHSLGWLDCFGVDDLGYTSLKLTYTYIAPEWIRTPQKGNMTNLWTELEVKTNTSSFDVCGRNWGTFQVGFGIPWVPWKKSLLMGLFGSTNLKILHRQHLELNEIWSLRTPKEKKQNIFGRKGVSE